MAPTPGHPNAEDRPYPTFDAASTILRCFRCHSTGQPKLNAGFTVEPAENGVRCKACHGPGAARADSYYGSAVRAEEAASGREHPRVAILLNALALALKEKNDFKSAEPLLRRALLIQQKAYGGERFQTATTLGNLAGVVQAQGQLEEAERLQRDALRIFEQRLPESAELAACTNLADLFATRGDAAGAIGLLRRALSIDEAIYGLDDPEVAGDLTNLAGLLRESGQPRAAQPLLERALKIYESKLGPASPQVSELRRALGR
jgi:tetratricopeptide (TPR) repeat protein